MNKPHLHIVSVYDNEGSTKDRYTLEVFANGERYIIGTDAGANIWSVIEGALYTDEELDAKLTLGMEIDYSELPEDLRTTIEGYFKDDGNELSSDGVQDFVVLKYSDDLLSDENLEEFYSCKEIVEDSLKDLQDDIRTLDILFSPYRRKVLLNHEKIDKDEKFLWDTDNMLLVNKSRYLFNDFRWGKIKTGLKQLGKGYTTRRLALSAFKHNKVDSISLSNGMELDKSEIDLVCDVRETYDRFQTFKSIQSELGSDNLLPININTMPYIHLDEDDVVVEIQLSTRNKYSYAITKDLLTKFITEFSRYGYNEQVSIVDLRFRKGGGELNLKCKESDIHVIEWVVQKVISDYRHHSIMEGSRYHVGVNFISARDYSNTQYLIIPTNILSKLKMKLDVEEYDYNFTFYRSYKIAGMFKSQVSKTEGY